MDNWQEHIDAYLDGRMAPGDRDAFEKEVAQNAALSEALEEEQAARVALEVTGDAAFREQVRQIGERVSQRHRMRKLPGRNLWRAAAIVAGIIFSLWLVTLSIGTSNEELFAEHFEPYRPPIQTRAPGDSLDNFGKGAQFYSQAQFDSSAYYFGLSAKRATQEKLFYEGVSLLAQDPPNAKLALDRFNKALLYEGPYGDPISWYRALALIRQGELNNAISILEALQTDGLAYREKAEALLKEIR